MRQKREIDPAYLEFAPWVVNHLIPMVKDDLVFFKSVCDMYKPKEGLTETVWRKLYQKTLEICSFSKDLEFVNYFNVERLQNSKWHKDHSILYFVRADRHIQSAANFIKNALSCAGTDKPEYDEDVCCYQALVHLYGFLVTQEK